MKSSSQINLAISNNSNNTSATKPQLSDNASKCQIAYEKAARNHAKNNSTAVSPVVLGAQKPFGINSFGGTLNPYNIYSGGDSNSNLKPIGQREPIGAKLSIDSTKEIDIEFSRKSSEVKKLESPNIQDLSSIVNMTNQEQADGVEEEILRHIDSGEKKGKFKKIYTGKPPQIEEEKIIKVDLYKMKTPLKVGGQNQIGNFNNLNGQKPKHSTPSSTALNKKGTGSSSFIENNEGKKTPTLKSHGRDKINEEKKFEIQNLEEARDKLRRFKHQLTKVSTNLAQGFNEELRGDILSLLQDFLKNKYAISANDRQLLMKLEVILQSRPVAKPGNKIFYFLNIFLNLNESNR